MHGVEGEVSLERRIEKQATGELPSELSVFAKRSG